MEWLAEQADPLADEPFIFWTLFICTTFNILAPSYSKTRTQDSDVITDISSVDEVGVFAQITSVFAAVGRGESAREEGLTAVLYPHRRIKITELVKPGPAKPPQVQPQSVEPPTPPPSESFSVSRLTSC